MLYNYLGGGGNTNTPTCIGFKGEGLTGAQAQVGIQCLERVPGWHESGHSQR